MMNTHRVWHLSILTCLLMVTDVGCISNSGDRYVKTAQSGFLAFTPGVFVESIDGRNAPTSYYAFPSPKRAVWILSGRHTLNLFLQVDHEVISNTRDGTMNNSSSGAIDVDILSGHRYLIRYVIIDNDGPKFSVELLDTTDEQKAAISAGRWVLDGSSRYYPSGTNR